MEHHEHILGCLLGTALGDAVGLRREGLTARRADKLYGRRPLSPNFMFGLGFCSDDTEHTQMVGRALVLSDGNVAQFERELGRQFRRWLMTIPAGIGFATLRACLKLTVGFSPASSGVTSAGNGPAMRSALLGVWSRSDQQLRELVRVCTRITHLDPKAEEGALLVAQAARLAHAKCEQHPIDFLESSIASINGDELRDLMTHVVAGLRNNVMPTDFAVAQGWTQGVSGYINHSVPAALYCWGYSPTDFRQCVENAVLLGGDTDSVAAITGAICGGNLGFQRLPTDWLDGLTEWPRNQSWMRRLSEQLTAPRSSESPTKTVKMHWLATLLRNLVFATLVLALGFRRLLPPY